MMLQVIVYICLTLAIFVVTRIVVLRDNEVCSIPLNIDIALFIWAIIISTLLMSFSVMLWKLTTTAPFNIIIASFVSMFFLMKYITDKHDHIDTIKTVIPRDLNKLFKKKPHKQNIESDARFCSYCGGVCESIGKSLWLCRYCYVVWKVEQSFLLPDTIHAFYLKHLVFEHISYCPYCGHEFTPIDGYYRCGKCGKELIVEEHKYENNRWTFLADAEAREVYLSELTRAFESSRK